jgi:hypothetical protein
MKANKLMKFQIPYFKISSLPADVAQLVEQLIRNQ